ncbi:MAG: SpoIID/LytB domain-containing protein [Deltaproteobacteria bacterium]|uniref:SpoIID/LytB domain-containing protein n=1 Tax=Candidatus Zymogenus saltonus TaxID=2844893 RepID=A0A9D8KCD3_9DELT|nr:SpoIID/LytB domain-containing protein [Candidatus Zymogenus saltonus]
MKARINKGRLRIAVFIFLLLVVSAVWAGIDTIGAEPGGRELKVRILEGRIEGDAVISSNGPLTVSFKRREIVIKNEKLPITASEGGRLSLKFGNGEHKTTGEIEIRSKGGAPLTIASDRGGMKSRSYRGRLRIYNDGVTVAVINIVPVEDYLYSVVASEISAREPEAVKAQAILSRTYVLGNMGRHGVYDFCDKTHCQHYGGAGVETALSVRAVDETRGRLLLFNGKPARVFYHACCGGVTTTPAHVWGGDDLPYLKPVVCRLPGRGGYLCGGSGHFRWEARIDGETMRTLLSDSFGVKAEGLKIISRDPSGRVEKMEITGPEARVISGEEFRIAAGRALGWSTIKSALFEMDISGGYYLFKGRGLGHGVGMCQEGAIRLSRLGLNHEEIIEFYFPGAKVGEAKDW